MRQHDSLGCLKPITAENLAGSECKKGTQGAFLTVLRREAGLFGAQYRKTFFEAVNTTTYIQNFLLTSVERVAS